VTTAAHAPTAHAPSRLACWVGAARPRTLPAAVAPVLVGSACAARAGGFDLATASLALAVALLLQIGTNFVNDWGDHRRGADGPDRLGPARAVAAGWISPRRMAAAGLGAFALAAVLGAALVLRGGLPAALLGAASIAAGIAYTAGPFPLAYRGLGEPFVLAFFGPVAVCGTELVQRGEVSVLALAASLPVGALATAILVVNNVRDVASDARAGKRTLAVRIGAHTARRVYRALVVGALASPLLLWALGLAPPTALVALAAAPLARSPLAALAWRSDGAALNAALAATARVHLVFGALLAAGIALPDLIAGGAP
jgi:1,4-dihydroxy-2-naphthoate octaprenyltransferase